MAKVQMLATAEQKQRNDYTGITSILLERTCKIGSWITEYKRSDFTYTEWYSLIGLVKGCSDYANYFARMDDTLLISTSKRPKSFKVHDITTGIIYDSMVDCSKGFGYYRTSIPKKFYYNGYGLIDVKGHKLVIVEG